MKCDPGGTSSVKCDPGIGSNLMLIMLIKMPLYYADGYFPCATV